MAIERGTELTVPEFELMFRDRAVTLNFNCIIPTDTFGDLSDIKPFYHSLDFIRSMIDCTFGKFHMFVDKSEGQKGEVLEWLDMWKVSWNPFFFHQQVWLPDGSQNFADFTIERVGWIQNALDRPLIHVESDPQIAQEIATRVPKAHVVLMNGGNELSLPNLTAASQMDSSLNQVNLLDAYSLFLTRDFWEKVDR